MNKLKQIFFLSLFILVFQNFSSSQISLSFGPSLGLTLPTGSYGGTTNDFYSGKGYGLGSGVNFGAIVKAKVLFLSVRAAANYTTLKNSGTSEPGQGSVDTKQSMFMFSVGPEFSLGLPLVPIKPYFGLDLLFTSFTGEATFSGVSKVPTGTYQMNSASRTGLGIGAGVEFALGKKYSLDIGIRYNMHNLFSKSFTSGTDRLASYTSLNDDADPQSSSDPDKHPISSSRTISTLQFNLGFLFDF